MHTIIMIISRSILFNLNLVSWKKNTTAKYWSGYMRHFANTLGQRWAIISEQPVSANYFRYNQSEAQRIELADKSIFDNVAVL